MWKGFEMLETICLLKPVKGINTTENSFLPQNEPHTANPSFPDDLKHFRGNQ